MKRYLLLIIMALASVGVRANETCPHSIQDASVMLTLPGETNLRITSSAMCNQKAYFADRFFDGDVEIWKKGKLVGKFYSRKISYDLQTFKIVLQNSLLIESELIKSQKFKEATLVMVDLKKGRMNSNKGEFRF